MSTIYATLINQYKFKYETAFSQRFDKQHDDDQVLVEIELYIKLTLNQNLAQSEYDNLNN